MSDDTLRLLVRKLERHAPLDAEDRRAILGLPHEVKKLDAHTYTAREGERPTACVILLSGFAYRQKVTGEGGRQIVAVHIPGEPLDFQNLFLDESDHSVQMLTPGNVAVIPMKPLQELARSRSGVGHAILVNTLVDASVFREWLLNIGRRDAATRLAHLLCEFAIRMEGQNLIPEYGYELPMTQEQLADATGLTPVHINRTLKHLEAQGLISRDKRRVSFPDWRQMRAFGDFSQRYLHLEPQFSGATEMMGA